MVIIPKVLIKPIIALATLFDFKMRVTLIFRMARGKMWPVHSFTNLSIRKI
jgi:hypothetical protein